MKKEEALEQICKWDFLNEEEKEVLETIIPELRESEDERIRKAIVGLIEELQRSDKNFAGVELTDMLAYMEKQKEQKPAEWSEEEKRKLNRIYSIIGWAMDEHAFSSCKKLLGDKEGIELQDFLRSIAKPKQEWSEEEKEILDSILSHYVLIDKPIDANGISKEKYISLIKSIRFDTYKNCNSHWKPSEEQMKALQWWSELPICSPGLKSLYEDLKKLI